MPSRNLELAAAWLRKAEHDLENARLLVREQNRLFDVASYHCQQAGEKALKAFLTANDIPFPRIHALGELLDLCRDRLPEFEQFRLEAEVLSPLVHRFRYPGDVNEPTREEIERALQAAERLHAFCGRQISDQERHC